MAAQTIPTTYIADSGFIGVSLESTFGTYNSTISDWLDVKSDTLEADPGMEVVEVIRADRSSDNLSISGLSGVGGDIDMPFYPTTGLTLLACALGTDTITGSGDPYTHTITPRQDGIPSISVEKNLGKVNGTRVNSLRYSGCLVDKMTLTGATKGPVMAKYTLKGQKAATGTATANPTVTTEAPYSIAQIAFTTIYSTSGDTTVKAFEVTVDNKTDVEPTFAGTQYPTYVYSGDRKITGKLTVIFVGLTRYTDALANTPGTLVMTLSQSSDRQAVITADTIVWGKPSQPLTIGKLVVQELPFTAINTQGNTNGHLKIVAKNAVSTSYT